MVQTAALPWHKWFLLQLIVGLLIVMLFKSLLSYGQTNVIVTWGNHRMNTMLTIHVHAVWVHAHELTVMRSLSTRVSSTVAIPKGYTLVTYLKCRRMSFPQMSVSWVHSSCIQHEVLCVPLRSVLLGSCVGAPQNTPLLVTWKCQAG